jgi:hypothetical protein
LKHETDLAATERRETRRLDEERRQSFAADQLIAALADFTTVNRDDERTLRRLSCESWRQRTFIENGKVAPPHCCEWVPATHTLSRQNCATDGMR